MNFKRKNDFNNDVFNNNDYDIIDDDSISSPNSTINDNESKIEYSDDDSISSPNSTRSDNESKIEYSDDDYMSSNSNSESKEDFNDSSSDEELIELRKRNNINKIKKQKNENLNNFDSDSDEITSNEYLCSQCIYMILNYILIFILSWLGYKAIESILNNK